MADKVTIERFQTELANPAMQEAIKNDPDKAATVLANKLIPNTPVYRNGDLSGDAGR